MSAVRMSDMKEGGPRGSLTEGVGEKERGP
jgi:hypothetical protein